MLKFVDFARSSWPNVIHKPPNQDIICVSILKKIDENRVSYICVNTDSDDVNYLEKNYLSRYKYEKKSKILGFISACTPRGRSISEMFSCMLKASFDALNVSDFQNYKMSKEAETERIIVSFPTNYPSDSFFALEDLVNIIHKSPVRAIGIYSTNDPKFLSKEFIEENNVLDLREELKKIKK